MRTVRITSLAAIAAPVILALAGTPAQASTGPHIGAKPRNVMVTNETTLKGSGFPANTAVELTECGAANWLVPEEPCDNTNQVTVTTNAKGRFTTQFTVAVCPRTVPPKGPVTKEHCYIGERQLTGEDTEGLLGAARITVTYP